MKSVFLGRTFLAVVLKRTVQFTNSNFQLYSRVRSEEQGMGRRGQAAALFPLAVACVACLFANPRAQCRAAAATSTSTSARKRLQSRLLAPPAGCWRLRGGGGGIEDNVTPQDIAEIGGDVLKMWHVSHQETGRNSLTQPFSCCRGMC